jgi:hypothetical protein
VTSLWLIDESLEACLRLIVAIRLSFLLFDTLFIRRGGRATLAFLALGIDIILHMNRLSGTNDRVDVACILKG